MHMTLDLFLDGYKTWVNLTAQTVASVVIMQLSVNTTVTLLISGSALLQLLKIFLLVSFAHSLISDHHWGFRLASAWLNNLQILLMHRSE